MSLSNLTKYTNKVSVWSEIKKLKRSSQKIYSKTWKRNLCKCIRRIISKNKNNGGDDYKFFHQYNDSKHIFNFEREFLRVKK